MYENLTSSSTSSFSSSFSSTGLPPRSNHPRHRSHPQTRLLPFLLLLLLLLPARCPSPQNPPLPPLLPPSLPTNNKEGREGGRGRRKGRAPGLPFRQATTKGRGGDCIGGSWKVREGGREGGRKGGREREENEGHSIMIYTHPSFFSFLSLGKLLCFRPFSPPSLLPSLTTPLFLLVTLRRWVTGLCFAFFSKRTRRECFGCWTCAFR